MKESKVSKCSEQTKRKIANSLKELMMKSSFDKITVSDITDRCGIHRQTFYYHFQDRYELLDWLLYDEIVSPLINGFSIDNMYEKIYEMFLTMSNDKEFYQNAIKINSDDLYRYISRIAVEQFTQMIKTVSGSAVSESNDIIMAEFIGFGISGIVVSWVQRGMKESPKDMTEKIENIVAGFKKIAAGRTD